jgi:pimeloyl-ACP methyl ester carboxylesterase
MIRFTAFQPPKSNYEIVKAEHNPNKGTPTDDTYQLALYDNNNEKFIPKDMDGITSKVFLLRTKKDNSIPAIYFENMKAKHNTVILYSHGNSTDIGRMRNYLQDIAFTVNVNVFSYEYSGYGTSTGTPSDVNLLYDIEAAYTFLIEKLGYKWHNIILYGRSIGSGPSTYLAAHPSFKVGGLILHSPIASGVRILKFNVKETPKYDLFPNCDIIKHVRCFVYIFHGDHDVEVPLCHGRLLASNVKNLYETWWVEGGGHNDIDCKFRKTYFIKLAKYLKFLKDIKEKKTPKELEDSCKVENWTKNSEHLYYNMPSTSKHGSNKKDRSSMYVNGSQMKLIDTSSFASSVSFTASQNNTTISKPEKNNTDSEMTVQETQRKNVIETTRSMCDFYDEDKKDTEPAKIQTYKRKEIELEVSYSARSDATVLRQHHDESYIKKTLHTQEDLLNNAHIDESMTQITQYNENPPPLNGMSQLTSNSMINLVKVSEQKPISSKS